MEDGADAPVRLTGLLTLADVRAWRRPGLLRVTGRLVAIWAQLVGAVALFVLFPNPLSFVVSFVLVAGGQHVMSLASHEFVHYLVFPDHRRLNDWVGEWLFSAPVGLPLAVFRHRHFAHHRLYSRDDDTKRAYRDSFRGRGLAVQLLRCMGGIDHLSRILDAAGRSKAESARGAGPDPTWSFVPTLVAQLVLLGLFSLVDPLLYFALWAVPLVTLTQLLHKIRATVEHQPLESEAWVTPSSGYFMDTSGPYVRSLRGNGLERFFLSAMNFGYHAEHHLYPQVSYQHLPKIRERLIAAGSFADPRLSLEHSYYQTVRKLWLGEGVAAG